MKKLKWLVVMMIVSSAACGSKSSTAPSNTAPVAQVYEETQVGTVSSFGNTFHPLTTPRGGNMTVTLTWSGGDLDLYLTSAGCNVYPKGNCQILVASDAVNTSSEQIKRTVTQGETFKLWVDNFATFPVSYTLRMRID